MIEASPTLRARVYWWFERPDRNADGPLLLEIALIVLISLNVGAVILETVAPIYARWKFAFDLFETVSLLVFTAEYLARLWVAPENPEVRSRRDWATSPLAVVDLLAILPAVLGMLFPLDLRILRTLRMLRLLKLTRYSPALGMLLAVFEEEAGAFLAGFFILVLMLIFASSGAWLAEHEAQPEAFGSIPSAMWWAVATLTIVGYGDVMPVTVAGKIFGAIITIVGIDVHWHPFELNPQMADDGENLREHLAAKYGTTPEGSRKARARLAEMGAALGFTFNYADDMRMVNTFRAHQLIDWAEDQGRAHDMKLALFAGFFTRREDLNNVDVLADVAASIGLDRDTARAMLESGERAESVRKKERFWTSRGVTGVPAMIFNRQHLVTGAQGEENYAHVLNQLQPAQAV